MTSLYTIKAVDDLRQAITQQDAFVIWLTGLSGAGKTTLGKALELRLLQDGHLTVRIDGDDLRMTINSDLGFSREHRAENVRRVAELSCLFANTGVIAIAALISPYEEDRMKAKYAIGSDRFVEVFLNTPLALCERRDTKGLYQKARRGEIMHFTGISDPFEEPTNPCVTIDSGTTSVDDSVQKVIECLRSRGLLPQHSNRDDRVIVNSRVLAATNTANSGSRHDYDI